MTIYDEILARLTDAGASARECVALSIGWSLRVLPEWERDYPDDNRPRQALIIAARYLAGDATVKDCRWASVNAAAACAERGGPGSTTNVYSIVYTAQAADQVAIVHPTAIREDLDRYYPAHLVGLHQAGANWTEIRRDEIVVVAKLFAAGHPAAVAYQKQASSHDLVALDAALERII